MKKYQKKTRRRYKLSVCMLHKALLIRSMISFYQFKNFFEKAKLDFLNEYILEIFYIKTPPETFISWKFHKSSFYTGYFEIYSEILHDIPLILVLLENELPLQVLCKNLAYISKILLLIFVGFFYNGN